MRLRAYSSVEQVCLQERDYQRSRRLLLIRGLPGSGKSTLARDLLASDPPIYEEHIEADQWMTASGLRSLAVSFESGGDYAFDPRRLQGAHTACFDAVNAALRSMRSVIVANTFTTAREVAPYWQLCKDLNLSYLGVLTAYGLFRSIHLVPEHAIRRMSDRWEGISPSILDRAALSIAPTTQVSRGI